MHTTQNKNRGFVRIKVVDTVLIPAGMYRIVMYTDIEMSTFRTGLNTDRTGHTDQFQAIPAGRYSKTGQNFLT